MGFVIAVGIVDTVDRKWEPVDMGWLFRFILDVGLIPSDVISPNVEKIWKTYPHVIHK